MDQHGGQKNVSDWRYRVYKQFEGFGIDYFLPSGTDEGGCYAATCAAIGVMMLAERMLQVSRNYNPRD